MATPRPFQPRGPGGCGLGGPSMSLSDRSGGRVSSRSPESLSQHPPPSLASTSAKRSPASSSPPLSAKDERTRRKSVSPSFMNAVARAQAQAQKSLRLALSSERAMRWREAIEYYRQLLKVLSKDKLPEEYVPGPLYRQLLLETYYHLGIAYQKLDLHRNAVEEFTNAIEDAHICKYACQVGCATTSFFHTPVFARRAYAFVKCGKIKEAISDANKAVELDTSNPDVYCVRALVWGSAKESRRALVDLNNSLRLNSSHICTLIIRGAIMNSLGGVTSPMHNKDHIKASSLCQDSQKFFDVQDFNSPKMSSFYDRYLWSLNAFHTVTDANLFSGATFLTKSPYSQYRSGKSSEVDGSQSKMKEPFKCGSMTVYPDNTSLIRRKMYSMLLRLEFDNGSSANWKAEWLGLFTQLSSQWDDNSVMKSEIHRGINTAAYAHKPSAFVDQHSTLKHWSVCKLRYYYIILKPDDHSVHFLHLPLTL